MNQTEFCNAVNFTFESLWPAIGPHKIIEFSDNVQNPDKYTCLVMVYEECGTTEVPNLLKKVYLCWIEDGDIVYSTVPKSEWPVGI